MTYSSRAEYYRQYRQMHKEQLEEHQRKFYEEHPEKRNEYMANYRQNHREEYNAYHREYYRKKKGEKNELDY